jgi:hypothetical protein
MKIATTHLLTRLAGLAGCEELLLPEIGIEPPEKKVLDAGCWMLDAGFWSWHPASASFSSFPGVAPRHKRILRVSSLVFKLRGNPEIYRPHRDEVDGPIASKAKCYFLRWNGPIVEIPGFKEWSGKISICFSFRVSVLIFNCVWTAEY